MFISREYVKACTLEIGSSRIYHISLYTDNSKYNTYTYLANNCLFLYVFEKILDMGSFLILSSYRVILFKAYHIIYIIVYYILYTINKFIFVVDLQYYNIVL